MGARIRRLPMQMHLMVIRATSPLAVAAVLGIAGCAAVPAVIAPPPVPEPTVPVPGTPEARRAPALPPVPAVDGPLALVVEYPPEGAAIAARDSNFIFGSTGSGRARLVINELPVAVAPNGGFLAFIPVPADGVYRLRATKDGEAATLVRTVQVPAAAVPPAGPHIGAPYPEGSFAVREGELIEIGFRGPAGGRAAVLLPTGERVRLVEQGAALERPAGEQFRTDAPAPRRVATMARYAAMVPVRSPLLSRDTALPQPGIGTLHAAPGAATAGDAVLELVLGADTARAPLRLNVAILPLERPRVGVATPPPDAAHDWTIRGRNDVTGPFHYFWPPGTRLAITGERAGMYRVRLAGNRTAWVPTGDVRLLPEGSPAPGSFIASARFAPQPHWIDLRIPTTERLPYQVLVDGGTLHIDVFGATSRANFFQYGAVDPLLTFAAWEQVADSIFRVTMRLDRPLWGYHTFFDAGGALVLRIRRPPDIDAAAPLRGLIVAVDPGHGGAETGARGTTGLTEADANLFISLRLRELLQLAGARVLMTRESDVLVPLGDRPRMAADSGAHLLVSVHNNAFPDGVNPWVNNGTSTYYYHPHAADLARVMQLELLDELGLRDIGYGRADFAMARPTWMPAVLTEIMFMMIPEQEAALRDPAVQQRIAEAHVRGLEAFLLRYALR
jgi:N-acetylmuramoyl-L-alanine amidase